MSYRVRTPDGELEFASLYEISKALGHGLVDGEDEVLVPGQTTWVRVSDHSALKAHVRTGKALRPGTPATDRGSPTPTSTCSSSPS